MFASVYPFVFEAMRILKRKDHRKLAIFLQQLESDIFIDCIAKALVETGIIPFTIHDSVIVMSKDQIKALQIIKSVFEKQLGAVPRFHVKPLKEESSESSTVLNELKIEPIEPAVERPLSNLDEGLYKQASDYGILYVKEWKWETETDKLFLFFKENPIPTYPIYMDAGTPANVPWAVVDKHFRDMRCYGMIEDTLSYMTRLQYLKLRIQKNNNE